MTRSIDCRHPMLSRGPGRRARRWALLGAAALLGLGTAACTPASLATNPQPVTAYQADQVRVAHELAFTPGSTALSPGALDGLDAFLYQVHVQPGDRVRIIGYGPLGPDRTIAVHNRLVQRGVVTATVATRAAPDDRVSVEVTRTIHMPVACLVETHMREEAGGAFLPTLGCANARNLASMVVNPGDLYGGTPPGLPDGVGPARAVDRYRATPSAATVTTSPLIPLVSSGGS